MAGGWSQIMPATEEVQKITDQVKQEAEEKMKKKYKIFTAKTYQQQVVAGMNFWIKVHADGDHLYLYVWEHPDGKLDLTDAVRRELSELHPASELTFSLDQIKQQAEDRTGKKYDIFRGINYKTLLPQLLGFTTYFIKVQVGEGIKDYLILSVGYGFSPKSKPTLTNLVEDKTLNDPIEYFE